MADIGSEPRPDLNAWLRVEAEQMRYTSRNQVVGISPCRKLGNRTSFECFNGEPCWIRTSDLLIKSAVSRGFDRARLTPQMPPKSDISGTFSPTPAPLHFARISCGFIPLASTVLTEIGLLIRVNFQEVFDCDLLDDRAGCDLSR
jgi:hypothetical protein